MQETKFHQRRKVFIEVVDVQCMVQPFENGLAAKGFTLRELDVFTLLLYVPNEDKPYMEKLNGQFIIHFILE